LPCAKKRLLIQGPTGERVLNIIVTVKQVLDPEAPLSTFKIDPEAKRAIPAGGIPPVLNPYDENALEAALRIKDLHQCKVTAISMGTKLATPVLRKCLAAGADELVLLEDEVFQDLDSYSTALILAAAIKKMGKYDLILTGRLAADTNAGQVGSGIAEITGIPSVTLAQKVEITQGRLRMERVISDGSEVVEAPLPALVTVSHELGELRRVPLRELMAAQKKQVTIWRRQDLGIESFPMSRMQMLKLYIPRREETCQIVEGKTDEEAAVNLALRLREAKIL
jgi:electron transfer flavoprotein beta subunit